MNISLKKRMDALQLSDTYSLMLFILYKVQDIPEYAVTSELCYLLDGSNMNRLLTYFAGRTVTFPTADEMTVTARALLLYQYINIEELPFATALEKLEIKSQAQKDKITTMYLKLLPIIKQYNIDRGVFKK